MATLKILERRLGMPTANYAVLAGGRIELRSTPYDTEATARAMTQVPVNDPGYIEEWQQCYRTGKLPERYAFREFASLVERGYR